MPDWSPAQPGRFRLPLSACNAPVHVRGNAPSVRAGEGMVKRSALRIASSTRFAPLTHVEGHPMNGIIYIVGLVVVVVALLSFFGLR